MNEYFEMDGYTSSQGGRGEVVCVRIKVAKPCLNIIASKCGNSNNTKMNKEKTEEKESDGEFFFIKLQSSSQANYCCVISLAQFLNKETIFKGWVLSLNITS